MEDNSPDNTTECFLTNNQIQIIRRTLLGCSSLSLLCCLLILFLIATLKKHRTATQRVILYLTITITLLSIAYVLHGFQGIGAGASTRSYCVTTAFLDQAISWMVGLAILSLNIDFVIKVVTRNFQTKRKYEIGYVVLIFGVPLVFNWIPFIHDTYGRANAYCWINNYNYAQGECLEENVNKFGVGLQFGLFWIPYAIVITASVVMYAYSLCRLRSHRHTYSAIYSPTEQFNRDLLYSEIKQYIYYTIVLIPTNYIAMTVRIVDAVIIERTYFSLQLLHVILLSLQGLPIAIVFVLDSDTRKDLFHWQKFKAALITFFCACRLTKVRAYKVMQVAPDAESIESQKEMTQSYN